MDLYNVSDNWQSYASMVSDIRTVCPIQKLAQYVSQNFVSKVYSYVATQKRTDSLGGEIFVLILNFNKTIPGQAIDLYIVSDNWQSCASMVSDIWTVCPLQKLAQYVSQNFVSKVLT